MELNAQFLSQFQRYYGKSFEIVTGRNAYTFDKDRHARMMEKDGIYLLLENAPQDNLKYKHDKALFIAARSVDKFFPTNDPTKIKASYHLGADKMRFEFHQQQHKLYQTQTCILKVVQFDNTRRDYRIDRKDYDYLLKNDGVFVFIYVVGVNIIMEVATLSAKSIIGFKDNQKSSLTLHFELSATVKIVPIEDAFKTQNTCNDCVSKGGGDCATCEPPSKQVRHFDKQTMFDAVDTYLNKGTPITIILPEGENELVLECTITKRERRIVHNDPKI